MKICYICADYGIPILGRKGCSTHVRETTRALKAAGHDVFIISPNPGKDPDSNFDIDIINVPPFRQKWLGSDLRYYFYNNRLNRRAAQLFQERKPDVIYERYSLYSTIGSKLAKCHNLPRILEVNSFLVHEQQTRLHFPWIADRVEKRILIRAPYVIVVSALLRDDFLKLGIPPERLTIMPMAVDVKIFRPDVAPAPLRENLSIPEGTTTVGYAGTLTAWHGINLLYDVAHQLKKCSAPIFLIVIGGDEEKVRQHQERVGAENLEDYIHFMGSVSYQEVPRYLSALDITLIPGSHPWASPTKLFEYQAMGKPSIAPRLIPVQEAMSHGEEGFLFEPGKPGEIVEHILTLHEDPGLRRKMGEAARERVVGTHAWEKNTERIVQIFHHLLEEKKRNGGTP